MATRSIVGFMDGEDFVGTYVHYDGYPEYQIQGIVNLLNTFAVSGNTSKDVYRKFTEWVNTGWQGGGYSSIDSEGPYDDISPEEAKPCALGSCGAEFDYILLEDFKLRFRSSFDDDFKEVQIGVVDGDKVSFETPVYSED